MTSTELSSSPPPSDVAISHLLFPFPVCSGTDGGVCLSSDREVPRRVTVASVGEGDVAIGFRAPAAVDAAVMRFDDPTASVTALVRARSASTLVSRWDSSASVGTLSKQHAALLFGLPADGHGTSSGPACGCWAVAGVCCSSDG
jgi:hypothetical protein